MLPLLVIHTQNHILEKCQSITQIYIHTYIELRDLSNVRNPLITSTYIINELKQILRKPNMCYH